VSDESNALAEGFYWYAEKLMWGYENVTPNPEEAFRFYRQAADLGFSDAMIRMGELLEHGKGVAQNAKDALVQYQKAANAGNFLGWGFIARFLSRTKHHPKAEAYWDLFFRSLEESGEPRFVAETVAGVIHMYLEAQLQRGFSPQHAALIRHHRLPLIEHHQHLLEHASDKRLDLLKSVGAWMSENL
jgi:TPR repeat protein